MLFYAKHFLDTRKFYIVLINLSFWGVFMPIVGFNFTKIDVEKSDNAKGNVNIHNNVTIKNIEKADVSFSGDKQNVVRFSFEFTAKYEPSIGNIFFGGAVLYLDEQKKTKEILDSWKKDKKIEKSLMTSILNTVLAKCNIQALILSQEVNLPPPVPLPKVQVNEPESNNNSYIG